jgi:hypothetical protein
LGEAKSPACQLIILNEREVQVAYARAPASETAK